MSKLHPLDQLCIGSHVRYATSFTAATVLSYCRDLENLCQELCWTAINYLKDTGPLDDDWWFTIGITYDPTVEPLRLKIHIPGVVFRESVNVVVPCLMRTMRDIYDGKYGPDKVQMGGALLAQWEDLL